MPLAVAFFLEISESSEFSEISEIFEISEFSEFSESAHSGSILELLGKIALPVGKNVVSLPRFFEVSSVMGN